MLHANFQVFKQQNNDKKKQQYKLNIFENSAENTPILSGNIYDVNLIKIEQFCEAQCNGKMPDYMAMLDNARKHKLQ